MALAAPTLLAACVALALLAAPSPLRAAEPVPVALVVEEGLHCPDGVAFVRAVRGHFPEGDVVLAGPDGARVRVDIRQDRDGVVGEMVLRRTGAARQIHGAACDEVFGAVALIVALALQEEERPLDEDATEPPAPALVPPPPVAEGPSPVSRARPPAESSAPGQSGSLGASAAALLGLAPSLSVGTRLHGTWAPVSLRDARLAVRPTVLLAMNAETDLDGGAARFQLVAGGVDVCRATSASTEVLFSPCAGLESGRLSATGLGVEPPRSTDRFWLAARVSVGGRIPLSGPLGLALEGAAVFPLTRDTFFFEGPPRDEHATPWVLGLAAVGLDVALP